MTRANLDNILQSYPVVQTCVGKLCPSGSRSKPPRTAVARQLGCWGLVFSKDALPREKGPCLAAWHCFEEKRGDRRNFSHFADTACWWTVACRFIPPYCAGSAPCGVTQYSVHTTPRP
ncbi:hypothetical protein IF2G_08293 [Cordyceps javanica]|nr:hypothetical protein IF2G_08293 [Cordyceps javanica]